MSCTIALLYKAGCPPLHQHQLLGYQQQVCRLARCLDWEQARHAISCFDPVVSAHYAHIDTTAGTSSISPSPWYFIMMRPRPRELLLCPFALPCCRTQLKNLGVSLSDLQSSGLQ